MYPLPISMIALIAGASLHINSAAAETDVPRLPDIIPPLELSEEDTPPPPLCARYAAIRYSARAINSAPTLNKMRCVQLKNVASRMVSSTRLPNPVPMSEAIIAASNK
jgi:hypothetical protein